MIALTKAQIRKVPSLCDEFGPGAAQGRGYFRKRALIGPRPPLRQNHVVGELALSPKPAQNSDMRRPLAYLGFGPHHAILTCTTVTFARPASSTPCLPPTLSPLPRQSQRRLNVAPISQAHHVAMFLWTALSLPQSLYRSHSHFEG